MYGHRVHSTKLDAAAAVRARPLAERHDAAARAVDPRQAAHLSDHLRVHGPAPLPVDRVVRSAVDRWMLPAKRLTDSMAAGWDRPQEDEFALANLGIPSPYLSWAFPNHGPVNDDYLDLTSISAAERERWKKDAAELRPPRVFAPQWPNRAQVADPHRPCPHAARDLPRRPLRPRRPQSARRLSFDGAALDEALPNAGSAIGRGHARRGSSRRSSTPSCGCTSGSSAIAI